MTRPSAGLHHEIHGPHAKGTPVLLLHGLGSSSADWAFQVPAFAERHPVVVLDLPGHGRSPRLRRRCTIDAMAAEVAAVLDALGGGPVHVVGLSLGGCVGLALAAGAPRRVRSLTLVNAFARLRPAGPRAALALLARLALVAAEQSGEKDGRNDGVEPGGYEEGRESSTLTATRSGPTPSTAKRFRSMAFMFPNAAWRPQPSEAPRLRRGASEPSGCGIELLAESPNEYRSASRDRGG